MNMQEMIERRRSVRRYDPTPLDADTLGEVRAIQDTLHPLDPSIRVRANVLPPESVRTFLPWKAPHWLAIYSDEKPGWLENVGFMYQQADLLLQSRGIGTCWVGMGRPNAKAEKPLGMSYAIMLAFGRPDGTLYRKPEEFKRKCMEEITDRPDGRLEPARLAPSSTNSQPWFFLHSEDGMIHAYRKDLSLLQKPIYDTMNRIDMGIALGQLYVAHTTTFRCYRAQTPPEVAGRQYVCSFML